MRQKTTPTRGGGGEDKWTEPSGCATQCRCLWWKLPAAEVDASYDDFITTLPSSQCPTTFPRGQSGVDPLPTLAGTDPEGPQVSPLWQCLNRFTREILIYDIILFTVAKFRFWLGLSSERFSGWFLVRSGFNTLYLGALWFGVCVFCLEGIINLCFIIIISWNLGGGGGGEKGPEHFLLFFFDEIILLLLWLLGIFCYFFVG